MMMGGLGGVALGGESRVIIASSGDFCDSLDSTVMTVNGVQTVRANAFSSLRVQLSEGCSRLCVISNANLTLSVDTTVGVSVDGNYQSLTPPATSSMRIMPVAIDPSSSHLVEITSGWVEYGTGGTWIVGVSTDGGSAQFLPNPLVNRRLAVYGDSIACGCYAPPVTANGLVPLLRNRYPGRISIEGWGGRRLSDDLDGSSAKVQALAARLVGLCFGSPVKEIWDEVGVNDWLASVDLEWYSAAVAGLYEAIHALAPSARIYAQTPLTTRNESATNSRGKTVGDMRAAKASACSGRSWVTCVDGPSLLAASGLADDYHPSAAGFVAYSASVADVLGT